MSGSKKALAMWGVQQLTKAGKPIPDSTKKAAGKAGCKEARESAEKLESKVTITKQRRQQ